MHAELSQMSSQIKFIFQNRRDNCLYIAALHEEKNLYIYAKHKMLARYSLKGKNTLKYD